MNQRWDNPIPISHTQVSCSLASKSVLNRNQLKVKKKKNLSLYKEVESALYGSASPAYLKRLQRALSAFVTKLENGRGLFKVI